MSNRSGWERRVCKFAVALHGTGEALPGLTGLTCCGVHWSQVGRR